MIDGRLEVEELPRPGINSGGKIQPKIRVRRNFNPHLPGIDLPELKCKWPMRPISYEWPRLLVNHEHPAPDFPDLRNTAVRCAERGGIRLLWSKEYFTDDASSRLSLN